MITNPPQKAPVHFGYAADMYVVDELLEECRAMMPNRVVIIGAGGNRQLQELREHLQVADELGIRMAPPRCGQSAVLIEAPSWAGEEPTRVRGSYYAPGRVKGKGQRKANRRARWK